MSPLLLPMQLPSMVAGQTAIEFGATGPNLVVATACASGASVIGTARDLLALDRCDIVITGGSEAMITPLNMAGFAKMGALSKREDDPATASRPFDADRDGFVAGEGTGVLVLERVADAHHMSSPHPDGVGIEAALRAALADAGAGPGDVQHVNAHGTGTPLNDLAEGRMLHRALTADSLATSTKGVTGHLLGAAGAVEAAFTVLAVERQLVPPTANLFTLDPRLDIKIPTAPTATRIDLAVSNSFGFGGQNAVLATARA